MSIEVLGRVTPIHMIGESHTLVFSNMLFRPSGVLETFICKSRYIPTLPASQYAGVSHIHPLLAEALVAEKILDQHLRPFFLNVIESVVYLSGQALIAPPIVIFAGDTALQELFLQIGDTFDFELPDDPGYGVDRNKQPIPYTEIRNQISKFVAPVIAAVRQLQSIGFSRTMVHCLPPRSADNGLAATYSSGTEVNAPVRSKLAVLVNRLLKSGCEETGLGFIDIWPEVAEDGYLRPEFELDGLHLNHDAALISLDKIAAYLFDQTGTNFNSTRYITARKLSDEYAGDEALNDMWHKVGFATGQLDPESAENILAELKFELGSRNCHARPDWVGWPRPGRAGAELAQPGEQTLSLAASALGQGLGRMLLHAGAECEMTIASFRPIRFSPAVASVSDELPAPPNGRRALLYLIKSDRIAFETLDGFAAPNSNFNEVVEAGTIIVFDPHRLRYYIKPGQENLTVIEISLIPRLSGEPFRIVWAGLCDWPADPFIYSVSNMSAFPTYKGDYFLKRASVAIGDGLQFGH